MKGSPDNHVVFNDPSDGCGTTWYMDCGCRFVFWCGEWVNLSMCATHGRIHLNLKSDREMAEHHYLLDAKVKGEHQLESEAS